MTTNKNTPLPVAEYLNEECNKFTMKSTRETQIVDFVDTIIPKLRAIEESSQKKAKKEEKERIVKVLNDMKPEFK